MDKIKKSLKKLSKKERERVRDILDQITEGEVAGLDLQKLHGNENVYRVRKGDLRIIFQKKKESVLILAIERRSEKTYKDF